jgi:hypothetical protein
MRTLILLVLLGCGSNDPNVFDPQDSAVAGIPTDAGKDTTTMPDGGYNACVEMTSTPTSYPRLLERDCVDSDGQAFMKDFWDIQLQLGCRWKPSMNGIRCLPENEISSLLYGDDLCSQSIAPVEVSNNLPVEPFVGLDHYDGGTMDYIDMFGVIDPWTGKTMYHQEEWGGEWNCSPLQFGFPGTRMYYVGVNVDPTIFVLQ